MTEKVSIELNIFDEDGIIKEKTTSKINEMSNGTQYLSVPDSYVRKGSTSGSSESNGGVSPTQSSQQINTQKYVTKSMRYYLMCLWDLCLPGSGRHAERQQRIQRILVSINSVEANLNQFPENSSRKCNKVMVENLLLCLAILFVAAIFTIPVPLYHTGPPINEIMEEISQQIKDCMPLNCTNVTSDACTNFIEESRHPIRFSGVNATEEKLTDLFDVISENQMCAQGAMPFFCNAAYVMCSNSTPGPGPEQYCEQLRNDTCRNQWEAMQGVSSTLTCCSSYNPSSPCPDQFDRFCEVLCSPVCGVFSQDNEAMTIAIDVIAAISMIFGNLGFGCILFIAAYFKRKTAFRYPNVLILYFTAVIMACGILVVLPIFRRKDLLCSHRSLIVSISESTAFCQVQGFSVHVTLVLYTALWLLFVFHLFMKVIDPTKSWVVNKPQHMTKIHVIEVLTVLFASLILPIINITSLDGYHIAEFPPTLCLTDPSVVFYGVIIPTIIMCTIGVSMILITFLSIHRTTGIFKKIKNKTTFALSVPEVKLLIISVYVVIVQITSWIWFTLNARNFSNLIDAIMDYADCARFSDCSHCYEKRRALEEASLPELTVLFYLALMFINCSNLLFIIQFKDVKKIIKQTKDFVSSEFLDKTSDQPLANNNSAVN